MQKALITILFTCITCLAMAQSKAAHTTHEVAKGETLYSISKRYHTTVVAIQKANKSLGENFKLKIGQKLIIPGSGTVQSSETQVQKQPAAMSSRSMKPVVPSPAPAAPAETHAAPGASIHIVAKGETAYGISRENGLTVTQLKDANHLPDDMKLKLGQKLIIPTKNQEAMYTPAAPAGAIPEKKPAPKPATAATTEPGREYLGTEPVHTAAKEPAKIDPPLPPKPAEQPAEPATPKAEKIRETPTDENPFLPGPPKPARPIASEPTKAPSVEVARPAPANSLKNENIDPNNYADVFGQYSSSGRKKVVYRGIGMFMQSDNPGNQFLALYNYADMGSILKVTNLMSKEAIYVKVIGKVSGSDNDKDVILKVSADAAKKLKVSEDKFLVEVTGYNAQ
jgi:LysM repeat protein